MSYESTAHRDFWRNFLLSTVGLATCVIIDGILRQYVLHLWIRTVVIVAVMLIADLSVSQFQKMRQESYILETADYNRFGMFVENSLGIICLPMGIAAVIYFENCGLPANHSDTVRVFGSSVLIFIGFQFWKQRLASWIDRKFL